VRPITLCMMLLCSWPLSALAQKSEVATGPITVTAKQDNSGHLADLHRYTEQNVCRTITSTGTRFTHKECHTAFEWNSISNDGGAYALYMQQRATELQFGGH
jgi:hypothetical protein